MSVKRYTLEMVSSEAGHIHWMHDNEEGVSAPLGEYVLHSDYAALLAATTWRPIETAPKDGTEVLLNCDGYFQIGSWCYDESEPARTVWACGSFMLHGPTHWMPIPKPPSV